MGDPNDSSILKGTALRGIQPTDSHGIATFDTLVPGHYEGRATHIHSTFFLHLDSFHVLVTVYMYYVLLGYYRIASLELVKDSFTMQAQHKN